MADIENGEKNGKKSQPNWTADENELLSNECSENNWIDKRFTDTMTLTRKNKFLAHLSEKWEMEWSQSEPSCFIVNDSQEENAQCGPKTMLATLKALQGTVQDAQGFPYSPRKSDIASSQKSRKNANGNNINQNPASGDSQSSSEEGEVSDGPHNHGEAPGGQGGPPGGGGGGGSGGGNGDGNSEDDTDQGSPEIEDGPHEEGQQPSSESTIGLSDCSGSAPALMVDSSSQENFSEVIPEPSVQVSNVGATGVGVQNILTSESDGGADVVSCSRQARLEGARHQSACVDITSSLSLHSSDEHPPSTVRRKAPLDKHHELPAPKRLKLDTSDTPHQSTATTSKAGANITAVVGAGSELQGQGIKLSRPRSDSPEVASLSHEGVEEGSAGEMSGSEQDMFSDDQGKSDPEVLDSHHQLANALQSNTQDEYNKTPAEKLGSLQFSQTNDDRDTDENSDIVPPSQNAKSAHLIFPNSPTLTDDIVYSDNETHQTMQTSGDKTLTSKPEEPSSSKGKGSSNGSSEKPLGGVQEWQPSYRSFDYNSRSNSSRKSSTSTRSSADSRTSPLEAPQSDRKSVSHGAAERQTAEGKAKCLVSEPLETQDVGFDCPRPRRITEVEQLTEADELRLHMTEVDTCQPINISRESTSPGLALRLSLTQVEEEEGNLCHSQFEDAEEDVNELDSSSRSLGSKEKQSSQSSQSNVSQRMHEKVGTDSSEKTESAPQGFRISRLQNEALRPPLPVTPPLRQRTQERPPGRLSVENTPGPSLTLDMISTMTEEDTEKTGFRLDRPDLHSLNQPSITEEAKSVFAKVRQMRQEPLQESPAKSSCDSGKVTEEIRQRLPRKQHGKTSREQQEKPSDDDKEVIFKNEEFRLAKNSSFYEKDTIDGDDGNCDTSAVTSTKTRPDKEPSKPIGDYSIDYSIGMLTSGNVKTASGQQSIEMKQEPHDNATRGTSKPETRLSSSVDHSKHESNEHMSNISRKGNVSRKTTKSKEISVVSHPLSGVENPPKASKSRKVKAQSSRARKTSNSNVSKASTTESSSDSLRNDHTPKFTKKPKLLKTKGRVLHYTAYIPGKGHILSRKLATTDVDQTEKGPSESTSKDTRRQPEVSVVGSTDPYEYRMSQSQRDRAEREAVKTLASRNKGGTNRPELEKPSENRSGPDKPSENRPYLDTPSTRLVEGDNTGTMERKTRQQRKNSPVSELPPEVAGPSNIQRDDQHRQAEECAKLLAAAMDTLPVHEDAHTTYTSGHLQKTSTKKDAETPPAQKKGATGRRGQVSFITTRIITVTRRTITLEQRLVDGVVAGVRKLDEKTEEISQKIEHDTDVLSSPSPSRSGHTLTSGDLGDLSSISSTSSVVAATTVHLGQQGALASAHASPAFPTPQPPTIVTTEEGKGTRRSTQGVPTHKALELVKSYGNQSAHPSPIEYASSLTEGGLPRTAQRELSESENRRFSDSIPAAQAARSISTDSTTHSKSSDQAFNAAFGLSIVTKTKQVLATKTSSSSTSTKQSESLFGTENSTTELAQISSKSSSGTGSLFSRTSSNQQSPAQFVRPRDTDIPLTSSKRRSSSSTSRTDGMGTSSERSSDIIPPSEPDTSGLNISRIRLAPGLRSPAVAKELDKTLTTTEKENKGEKEGDKESGDDISPEIPILGTITPHPAQCSRLERSSSEESETNVESFPPYWPTTEILVENTPVIAMWRDKHWYHGLVTGFDKNRYSVAFEDGDIKNVKATEVIVCDLLAVGQRCLAEREGTDGWQEEAAIVGHHKKGETRSCVVQFQDGTKARLTRDKLSLSKDHVDNLVTGVLLEKGSCATDNVANVLRERKSRTRRSGESSLTEIKPKVPIETTDEDYDPSPAYVPTPGGKPLLNSLPVYAKWVDRCYYPGFISEQDAKTSKYLVQFEDGTRRNLSCDDMIVCELVRTGQQVFADDGSGAYLKAEVTGHWRRGQLTGYRARFCDGKEASVERGKVILDDEAATSLKDELRPFSTLKPSAADVSLDNLVDGKRTRPSQSSPFRKNTQSKSIAKGSDKGSETETVTQISSTSTNSRATTGSKRKLEPKFTSTPTPKRRAEAPSHKRQHPLLKEWLTHPSLPGGLHGKPRLNFIRK